MRTIPIAMALAVFGCTPQQGQEPVIPDVDETSVDAWDDVETMRFVLPSNNVESLRFAGLWEVISIEGHPVISYKQILFATIAPKDARQHCNIYQVTFDPQDQSLFTYTPTGGPPSNASATYCFQGNTLLITSGSGEFRWTMGLRRPKGKAIS